MRPSQRFDVFKRDSFTCSYCGRRPPEVTLEVDHIIPRAEGGTDDPENLTTSCWDCNRGKGSVSLDVEPPQVPDLEQRAELIRERERQLRAYNEAQEERRARQEEQFEKVWDHWFDAWEEESLRRYHTPWESTIRKYIDLIGAAEVMEAMDLTAGRFPYVSTNAVRYFVGILKHKLAAVEGRRANCAVCGKWVILEPGDDPNEEWVHSGCQERADG